MAASALQTVMFYRPKAVSVLQRLFVRPVGWMPVKAVPRVPRLMEGRNTSVHKAVSL